MSAILHVFVNMEKIFHEYRKYLHKLNHSFISFESTSSGCMNFESFPRDPTFLHDLDSKNVQSVALTLKHDLRIKGSNRAQKYSHSEQSSFSPFEVKLNLTFRIFHLTSIKCKKLSRGHQDAGTGTLSLRAETEDQVFVQPEEGVALGGHLPEPPAHCGDITKKMDPHFSLGCLLKG